MAKVTRRIPNAERQTPRTDAWLATILPVFEERGARAELARFAIGADITPGQFKNWASIIARWKTRDSLPNLEQYFLVNEWLAGRKKKRQRSSRGRAIIPPP